MKRLHLSIPEPCHENWQQMTPAEKGRFCAACQKNVHDFTKSTDREIIKAYEKDQKLCGRFLNTQLDRELMIPRKRKSLWLASVFLGMISMWNTKANAQEKPKTEQNDTKNLDSGKSDTNIKSQGAEKTITGTVSDATGPIPLANIVVQGTTRGVEADFEGKYSIVVKEGEKLTFSFMGMEDITKTINSQSSIINVLLKDEITDKHIIQVVGGYPIRRSTNFIERAYRVVETWFEE
ncbi:carboxypeptidase-like regulatory domain-containing protein [Flavobacterium amniphilum]|uniref:carboxypeptidase-like regulatory domain-containing protein n=1 Tax=Flavobacterium amniphilum TaxID=1834035 RepID=UPI00202A5EAD|nr:carboxypeptidase-like regulatory domain-containing protein [Flavobacterium amniphilum]MCL9804328.1 carboxypeptidase-like regulatory domain-containing protein [Flavobacterium amniphilum]